VAIRRRHPGRHPCRRLARYRAFPRQRSRSRPRNLSRTRGRGTLLAPVTILLSASDPVGTSTCLGVTGRKGLHMALLGRRSFLRCAAAGLAAGYAGFVRSATTHPTYFNALTLEPGKEWRFNPLLIDIHGDGHLDLVATARLVKPALH